MSMIRLLWSPRMCGIALITCVFFVGGCMHPLRRNLEAYRAAKKRGDYETAAKYLAEDARIWFGKKAGPGRQLTAKGGPYKEWDKEFRSTSSKSDYVIEGRTVSYMAVEMNDYYLMLERQAGPARVTYYFDSDRKIIGMLYCGIPSATPRPPDRWEEFRKWSAEKYPGLLDSDEMEIPKQPKRWRELLTEWRSAAGLPPIK